MKKEKTSKSVEVKEEKCAKKMISIPEINWRPLSIILVGDDPGLVTHAWNPNEVDKMLEKQMGVAIETKKAPKNPVSNVYYSIHWIKRGVPGFPAGGVKKCIIQAADKDDGLAQTTTRKLLRILNHRGDTVSDLIEIHAPLMKPGFTDADEDFTSMEKYPNLPPQGWTVDEYKKTMKIIHQAGACMRMDMARVDNGNPDIRFRAWFPRWYMKVNLLYNADKINEAMLLNLINKAGMSIGLGEMRPFAPKSSGEFGTFHVKKPSEKLSC